LKKEIEDKKETFVATLTHDLKTPTLAQIKALELLYEGTFGELKKDQTEIIKQISNSCKYMLNMVSTLLSTYRYDEGIKNINCEEFDLIHLVNECKNELSCLAREKEQIILMKNNGNSIIYADKLEIKRVIINLISNAISHSFEKTEIEIYIQNEDKKVVFLVNSFGNTISHEKLEKLFDKYVSTSKKNGQSGLGLYLTKQIVNIHNGEIIAQSDELNGNTFGFEIPLNKVAIEKSPMLQ